MATSIIKSSEQFSYSIAPDNQTIRDDIIPHIANVYKKNGYLAVSEDKFEASKFLLGDYSRVYQVHLAGRLCGVISVYRDSPLGLPADAYYKEEIDAFRKKGLLVAEAGQFAVDHELLFSLTGKKIHMELVVRFFKCVLTYCREEKMNTLFAVSHTRHQGLYQRLGLKKVGGLRYYKTANNIPVVLFALDIHKTQQESTRLCMQERERERVIN